MLQKPPPPPRGFSLVEVIMASFLVLLVAGTTLALIARSTESLARARNRTLAENLTRAVTSYVRAMTWAELTGTNASTLTARLNQSFRAELFSFGATASLQVTAMTLSVGNRLLDIPIALTYGSEGATHTIRVSQSGINP